LSVVHRSRIATCLLAGLACLLGPATSTAQEEAGDPLVQMVIELLGDSDRDMRALGFQQVREEVPGEAATKQFAALLPKLPPDGQAGLLEALGDRGDAAARPAVLEMLKSQEEAVRAAALRALGALGTTSDVTLLAGKAAAGSKLEKDAARQSLVRLRGDQTNAAIVAAMAAGGAGVRVELLGVLAARNAKETLPNVLESTGAPEPSVRLAAIGALRFLADENQTAAIVEILKGAKSDAERRKAELTLLAACNRGREVCAEAILAGLADANAPSRVVLLHGLARAGGPKALEGVVARLDDEDQAVRDAAVRMLSIWPDQAAGAHLLVVAEAGKSLRHRVLAVRGLVRLASPREDKPADLGMLAEAMKLANRPQEKRLVLGVLGGVATPPSFVLATAALEDPELAEEAALATVMIVEKMEGGDKQRIRTAMEKVLQRAKRPEIRDRAQKVLSSL
jgi:HEAT repeat protein